MRAVSSSEVSRSAAAAAVSGLAVLVVGVGGDPVEQPGALLEVVGQVLGALAGLDLHLDGVVPRRQRVAPRLDAEGPAALAVGDDGRQPAVGLRRPNLAIRTNGGVVRPRPGGVQTTFAATASWPSRKTVAVIGRCSPTTARAENDPQDTTGATSEMPRRRSARPVIAATLSRSTPHQHLGCRQRTPGAPGWGCREPWCRVDLRFVPTPWRSGERWLVSSGASSSSVHRPCGAARTPDAPVPARDEPPVVLAPGDPRPLRDARPRPLAALRR